MIIRNLDFTNYENILDEDQDLKNIKNSKTNKSEENKQKLEVIRTIGFSEVDKCQKAIDEFVNELREMPVVICDINLLKHELESMIITSAKAFLTYDKDFAEGIGETKYKEIRKDIFKKLIEKYKVSTMKSEKEQPNEEPEKK